MDFTRTTKVIAGFATKFHPCWKLKLSTLRTAKAKSRESQGLGFHFLLVDAERDGKCEKMPVTAFLRPENESRLPTLL